MTMGSCGTASQSLSKRLVGCLCEVQEVRCVNAVLDLIVSLARLHRLRIGGRQAAMRYIAGSRMVRMVCRVDTPMAFRKYLSH